MKSKLFLSLSLLTAVFSINANAVTLTSDAGSFMLGAKSHGMIARVKALSTNQTVMQNAKLVGILTAPAVAVGGLYTAGSKLNSYMNPEVAPKLTYVQQAQQMIQNGYKSVKANAVKGYNSSLTFVKANPKSTAGAVQQLRLLVM